MKLKNLTPFLALIILAATSCKKETSEPDDSPISGNWKLSSIASNSISTATLTQAGYELKFENTSTFASTTTKGIYKISSTSFTGEGIGYEYTGTTSVKQYENDVLESEVTNPLNGASPASNGTSQINLIGNDSIYFQNILFSGTANTPGGCKYKLEGDKLSLFINQSSTTTTNVGGGIISTEKSNVTMTVVLQKQ